MELLYSVKCYVNYKIDEDIVQKMIKENVDISDMYEIEKWVNKNKIIDIDLFDADIEDYDLEDYELNDNEEEFLKKLKDEKEKNSPFKNQLTLFGGVVGV